MYRVDGTNDTLTLAQLEDQSLRLARALKKRYGIKPNDVISIAAKDKVVFPNRLLFKHFARADHLHGTFCRSNTPLPSSER